MPWIVLQCVCVSLKSTVFVSWFKPVLHVSPYLINFHWLKIVQNFFNSFVFKLVIFDWTLPHTCRNIQLHQPPWHVMTTNRNYTTIASWGLNFRLVFCIEKWEPWHFLRFNHYIYIVLIDAGSRYEIDHPSGLSHVIEKMAFKVSCMVLFGSVIR